jgi:conjugal transfer pilus assembly protein TraW
LELQENLNRELYFDQAGEITSRLGIKHVPAIVEAEMDKLKINEVKI